jgi:hypothetical protein
MRHSACPVPRFAVPNPSNALSTDELGVRNAAGRVYAVPLVDDGAGLSKAAP